MAVNLSPIWGAGAQLLDNSGNVLSGGKIYTYAAGTTTQVATYTSNTGATANSNPIILNSAGRVPYEIWLTDGQNYKFVLKDSNDVLIGTWDNLNGINSNFIAYTNQQEIQTATAGQTVFNLTTINYLPGTNSLSVFVDGVNQYGSGAQYAYTETDSDTVTFASGLHVGAEVKFTSSQIQNAGAVDASQVSYTPPFTNSVPTNVEDKLAQYVSVKDFGAVGDGVTDDTAAIQTAFNLSNAVVDGSNSTYRIDSALTCTGENIVIRNMTIDCSNIPSTGSRVDVLKFAGTAGSNVNLTANLTAGTATVTVGNTSTFSANQYVFIGSSKIWSSVTNAVYGQIAKVKTVDSSTQLTLYTNILYTFNTADTAYIKPITPKSNITFENVTLIGDDLATNLQVGIDFEYCVNTTVQNCNFEYLNYSGVFFSRCVDSNVLNSSFKYANGSGLSYGVGIVNASYGTLVDGCYGEDLRHLVTVGGTQGVNLFTTAVNNKIIGSRDAGLDAHPTSDRLNYSNNTVQLAASATTDGIIVQGGSHTITGNIIEGVGAKGIYSQIQTNGVAANIIISNNFIYMKSGSTGQGVYVYTFANATTSIRTLRISNNSIDGDCANHIYLWARGANMASVSINNNACYNASTGSSCFILAASSMEIASVTITGNNFKSDATGNVLEINGDATSPIRYVTVTGNVLFDGDYGIYGDYVYNLVERGNVFLDQAVSYYTVNHGTDFDVDNSYGKTQTSASTTETIANDINRYINSQSGTVTVTLPVAAIYVNKEIYFKNIQAQAINSASSNVVPIDTSTAGTAILPATDGAWCLLKSNGTSWVAIGKG